MFHAKSLVSARVACFREAGSEAAELGRQILFQRVEMAVSKFLFGEGEPHGCAGLKKNAVRRSGGSPGLFFLAKMGAKWLKIRKQQGLQAWKLKVLQRAFWKVQIVCVLDSSWARNLFSKKYI